MWPVMNSSALIGGKFNLKKKVQDLLFSLDAVISTNERNWIYNKSHGLKLGLYLNLTDDSHPTGNGNIRSYFYLWTE